MEGRRQFTAEGHIMNEPIYSGGAVCYGCIGNAQIAGHQPSGEQSPLNARQTAVFAADEKARPTRGSGQVEFGVGGDWSGRAWRIR